MRYLIPLFLFIVMMGFLWRSLHNDPHRLTSALMNSPIAAFNYPSLLNPQKPLTQALFLGQVSLLNIWATWCISCRAEEPILLEIAHSKKVTIYGLNYKDDLAAARSWLKKYGNPYTEVIADQKGTLAIDLGVYGTPETFIIDKQGIIRYRYVGPISFEVWRDKLAPEVEKWDR